MTARHPSAACECYYRPVLILPHGLNCFDYHSWSRQDVEIISISSIMTAAREINAAVQLVEGRRWRRRGPMLQIF
jgi:hypothetical protein